MKKQTAFVMLFLVIGLNDRGYAHAEPGECLTISFPSLSTLESARKYAEDAEKDPSCNWGAVKLLSINEVEIPVPEVDAREVLEWKVQRLRAQKDDLTQKYQAECFVIEKKIGELTAIEDKAGE